MYQPEALVHRADCPRSGWWMASGVRLPAYRRCATWHDGEAFLKQPSLALLLQDAEDRRDVDIRIALRPDSADAAVGQRPNFTRTFQDSSALLGVPCLRACRLLPWAGKVAMRFLVKG